MFPNGLSMLWESVDARRALQERFGFPTFDAAAEWLTAVLDETWAIGVETCDRIVISDQNAIAWVHTDHGHLVVKWSRATAQFAKFATTAELLHELHQQGIPVAAPLTALTGKHREVVDAPARPLSMTVQPHIDGTLLDIANDQAVYEAGVTLADLHTALAEHKTGPQDDPQPKQRLLNWLDSAGPGSAPEASAHLATQVAALPPLDVQPQLIHSDYRASNIVMSGTEVLAVLDFDELAWNYCVQDLAQTLVVLGTHFTNWQPTPPAVRRTFLAGYESIRPLTDAEHQWLAALTLHRAIQAIPPGEDPAGWRNAL
ncbi:phosphotransferase [Kribbella sp. VKM Ac-2568]|uniref:phosphotransferase n=1 Tax=Kribbella sp. VKM Ac-2568 TaxID=2512219 RepID=UPI001F5467ED|nr:phosphotransferase [Kribbella sp. VKM Ac-2568]